MNLCCKKEKNIALPHCGCMLLPTSEVVVYVYFTPDSNFKDFLKIINDSKWKFVPDLIIFLSVIFEI